MQKFKINYLTQFQNNQLVTIQTLKNFHLDKKNYQSNNLAGTHFFQFFSTVDIFIFIKTKLKEVF